MAKYDLAISFAGEQRDQAGAIAERLDAAGYSVFFDEFHQAELWGRDLTIAFGDVYSRDARWCLVLVSRDYVTKAWTNLERQNALLRHMTEHAGYLLCLTLDGSKLPGLPAVVGYVDAQKTGSEKIYQMLLEKLGDPAHEDLVPSVANADREIARRVLQRQLLWIAGTHLLTTPSPRTRLTSREIVGFGEREAYRPRTCEPPVTRAPRRLPILVFKWASSRPLDGGCSKPRENAGWPVTGACKLTRLAWTPRSQPGALCRCRGCMKFRDEDLGMKIGRVALRAHGSAVRAWGPIRARTPTWVWPRPDDRAPAQRRT